MADSNATEMAVAMGKGDCDGNGQWQRQWAMVTVTETVLAMATATAMAMATELAMAIKTVIAIAMATAPARATMTKGGLPLHVPVMCSTVAGVTPCLHPHGHKGVRIHQRCVMGVMLQSVFAPFQGGGFLTAHHVLFFYFLQLLFSLLNNPLFIPRINQALKNPVSPLMLYLFHSYFIFLQR
jgi:hypothetical protein